MKQFHKNRLLKLANYLETLPPHKFDLSVYAKRKSCGTVGCAIGNMPIVFPRLCKYEVLYYDDDDENAEINVVSRKRLPDSYYSSSTFPDSHYSALTYLKNDELAKHFFRLNSDEIDFLFYPYKYRKGQRGPKSVAKRIKQFVKNQKITVKWGTNYGW